MNCYFHPQTEGVVTCGKCGVAMCKECETNAFFRLDGGNGQALCNRCSLIEAQANVDFESSWLRKRIIKLIICTVLIVLGILSFVILNYGEDPGMALLMTIIFWAFSGAVANIGNKTNNGSVKEQVWTAVWEYRHPVMNMIIKILINAIFGPILLIAHFIGYARTKGQYKRDLEILENLKVVVNQ